MGIKTIKETDKKRYKDEDLASYLKQISEEQTNQEHIAREERKTFLKRRFYLLYEHGKI